MKKTIIDLARGYGRLVFGIIMAVIFAIVGGGGGYILAIIFLIIACA